VGRLGTRAAQDPELVRLDSAFMLYLMLDELLDYYSGLQDSLLGEIEEMQDMAIRNPPEDFLGHLLNFKRYVFALMQVATQHRPVFEAFLRPDFPFVAGEEVSRHFLTLDTRLERVVDSLMAAREEVTGAFDMYVSHEAHRTNQIIRVLTMVSAGLLPVTVILGFFETTFHGLGAYYSPVGFVVMLGLILITVIGVLTAFSRQGWL
jgi:magnesium transporter